jgi:hypothetical protein
MGGGVKWSSADATQNSKALGYSKYFCLLITNMKILLLHLWSLVGLNWQMFADGSCGNENKMSLFFIAVNLVISGHRNMKWWIHDPEIPTGFNEYFFTIKDIAIIQY